MGPSATTRAEKLRPFWAEEDVPATLVLIACAALACVVAPQSDTFFHLRAGQAIWHAGSVLRTDAFSHTAFGQPWHNHEWLSQVLLYGTYMLGGSPLLTLLTGGCAMAAVIASWKLMRGSSELRLVLLVSLLVLTTPEWAVRPQALSLALVMLAMWMAVRDAIILMPLLIVVWANAHGVVLFGVVIAAVNAVDAMLCDRPRAGRAVFVAGLCAAAPMATPLGWHYWPRVAQTVAEARALGIHEYRSAFADATAVPFWIMAIAFVAAVATRLPAIKKWERADRLLVLTAAIVAVASVLSTRNAPFFALIAAPALSRLVGGTERRRAVPVGRGGYVMVGLAAFVALVFVSARWADHGARLGWYPLSNAAVQAIRSCPAPMYNEYADGGTLMWFVPERKVFVDGRVEAYSIEFLKRSREADFGRQYKLLFQEYGVHCALTRRGSPIEAAIRADASFRPHFRDSKWVLFASID
jgi:hypothetical protein